MLDKLLPKKTLIQSVFNIMYARKNKWKKFIKYKKKNNFNKLKISHKSKKLKSGVLVYMLEYTV